MEDDGSGSLKSITDLNISNWIKFDSNNNFLNINPKGENIGNHFFKINAVDNKGLISSSIFSVNVKYINNKPFLNYTNELILEKVIAKGVDSIEIKTDEIENQNNHFKFNLSEQSEFSIDLPIDLFNDIDLLVDPNENLKYILIDNITDKPLLNNKNDLFEFDSLNLRFKGNTTDLGIDSLNGLKEYELKLKVEDNYGYSDSFDFVFSIQRQLKTPQVEKVINHVLRYHLDFHPEGHMMDHLDSKI